MTSVSSPRSRVVPVRPLAKTDPRFRHLLGGVWKNSIAEEVWRRVENCRSVVW